MSNVSVTLNGRNFTIGCEPGQEDYLRDLAGYLDEKVQTMSTQVGQIGDLRLLLMASLIVVDELKDAQRQIDTLNSHIDRIGRDSDGAVNELHQEREALANQVAQFASRLEALAETLDARESGEEQSPAAASDGRLADARA